MNKGTSDSQVIVITGASSGIGKAMADQLSQSGHFVYALARRLPDGLADPTQIRFFEPGLLCPVQLDVTDPVAAQRVVKQILERENRIDILVQAAGFGLAGAIEDATPEEMEAQIDTNLFGSCYLLNPVLAQMRLQHRGLIVQLSSVASFMPLPFQAYYSASKAAVTSLMLALANEVRPFHIQVMVVQPGDTHTGFTDSRIISSHSQRSSYAERSRRSVDKMAADEQKGMSSDRMASLIIRRMLRKKPPLIYIPGLFYKAAAGVQRIMPVRLVNALLYFLYAR